jgi:hypothetical protein
VSHISPYAVCRYAECRGTHQTNVKPFIPILYQGLLKTRPFSKKIKINNNRTKRGKVSIFDDAIR